jgi:hypothetical protein
LFSNRHDSGQFSVKNNGQKKLPDNKAIQILNINNIAHKKSNQSTYRNSIGVGVSDDKVDLVAELRSKTPKTQAGRSRQSPVNTQKTFDITAPYILQKLNKVSQLRKNQHDKNLLS